MTSERWYILGAILLAIALDLGLMRLAKRYLDRRKVGTGYANQEAKMFGVYSPVLTWLKYRRLPSVKPLTFAKSLTGISWGWVIEIGLIVAWAIWMGWPFLDLDPLVWPVGGEFSSHIQTHFVWTRMLQCGWCALWDGNVNGGFPAFADTLAGSLHPLIGVTTMIWGVINGAKVTVVALLALAGVAQWWIARELGLGRVARLWSAATAAAAGSLTSRMELGHVSVMLSTVMCGMCWAPALAVAKGKNVRAIILLAVCLALAAVSGQGYMQAGLALAAPAGLILLFDSKLKVRPIWTGYVVALGLALMLAAYFWVPLVHFLPNFYKDVDPGFKMGQPLEYLPLNFVIRDVAFLRSDALQKIAYPVINALYIGWVPVILAVLALRFARREDYRPLLFLAASFGLVLLTASTVLLRWLEPVMPAISGLRSAPVIGGLAAFPLLGLSAYGLDKLLSLKWPSISVSWEEGLPGNKIELKASWLLVIPLILGLSDLYTFSRNWFIAGPVQTANQQVIDALHTDSLEWVATPFGEHFFVSLAREAGLKLSPGITPWGWKNRPLPLPQLDANRNPQPAPAEYLSTVYGINIYRWPQREYASLQTPSGALACRASGIGGQINVDCSSDEAGRLVVQENYYAGWTAWLDHRPVPLQDKDWLVVDVPAGQHLIEFRYLPWDVPVGLLLTVLGINVSLWLWFRSSPSAPMENTDSAG